MKIAYIGKIPLSDVDLSYLHAAQKDGDVTYFLEINPRFRQGPAISIDRVARRNGVFRAVDLYPELARLHGFIDLDKFYAVNTCGRLWALKSLWVNLCLLFLLMRKGFTVVHLAWPPNVYEFALYALRKRMILTVHDPFPHADAKHNTLIVRLRRWCAFHLVRKFIILNQAQRPEFLEHYRLKEADVFSSRLSAYDFLQTVPPCPGLAPEGRYVLFAGRISEYKGIDTLLQAMTAVHKILPDAKLVIAGSGEFPFDLSPYKGLDYIEIRNRFIPQQELVTLISQCEFLVCPYTNATQSGVIMSAFAFAKPVIATEVGGLPEMLGHGSLSPLVPPADAPTLAKAMAALLADSNNINRYSARIREAYLQGQMSWAAIAKEIRACYSIINSESS